VPPTLLNRVLPGHLKIETSKLATGWAAVT